MHIYIHTQVSRMGLVGNAMIRIRRLSRFEIFTIFYPRPSFWVFGTYFVRTWEEVDGYLCTK